MNILFSASYNAYAQHLFLPYGAALVATNAKAHSFNVLGMDFKFGESREAFKAHLKDKVISCGIDIVAFTGFSADYTDIEELISFVKDLGCLTVLGGLLVNYSADIVPRNIGADYCMQGECENSFVELLRVLESCSTEDDKVDKLRNVPGLYYKGEPIGRFDVPLYLDQLLDIIIDTEISNMAEYFKYRGTLMTFMSRSCPFNCTFCVNDGKIPYRKREIDTVIKEIQTFLDKFPNQIERLIFWEELFDFSPGFAADFADKIKSLDIEFFIQVRANSINEKAIKILQNAGLKGFLIGIESADNRVLQSMRKKAKVEMYREKIELCNKYGLSVMGGIIVGDPMDDMQSLQANISFYKENLSKVKMTFNKIKYFPSTDLYYLAREKGLIEDELAYLKKGDYYINLSQMPDSVYEGLDAFFSKMYIGANYIASPIGLEHNLTINGIVETTVICPTCLKTVTVTKHDDIIFGMVTSVCPDCGRYLSYEHSQYFYEVKQDDAYQMFFTQYKDKRIAIYGMNSLQVKSALLSSQTLRECLVACVDRDYVNFKNTKFMSIEVRQPQALKNESYDLLIVGAESSKTRTEIIKLIDDMEVCANIIKGFPFISG